jgi:hypothetical protein
MPEAQQESRRTGNLDSQTQQGDTFRERKMSELSEEKTSGREDAPVNLRDRHDDRHLDERLESESEPMDYQDGYADEEGDQYLADDQSGALDEDGETPLGTEPAGEEDDNVNWQKRYKDLQSESQRILESNKGMEQEHAQAMQQVLEARFQLDDQLSEAESRAGFILQTMTGNANQYRNINWAQVPPDQVAQVQAQAQHALQMEQQAQAAYQQVTQVNEQTRDTAKQREAAIAKVRLKRTIPNWGNETYNALRSFAAERGMPVRVFNEITDPVLMEAIHAYQTMAQAGSSVQKVKSSRRPNAPRGRGKPGSQRNDRGQFAKKAVEPNNRGSFADKHRHRLAMERKGPN